MLRKLATSLSTMRRGSAGSSYKLGVDGLAISLVVLTTALMPLCILQSAKSIEDRLAEYMIAFLLLETLMIGVFCALDLVLFYVFFEGGLIPMFLIIGVWGGKNKLYAAFKFFLYTLLGSLLLLAALIYMSMVAGTTDVPTLQEGLHPETGALLFPPEVQTWLWLAFFASFAVKLPMFPVHTWLPDAHVEAPTAGSVVLAAVLLKMGGYGFLRFSLPMFPEASQLFQPLMFGLSGDRDRLRLAGRLPADRHQEAGGVLVGRAHGLRDARHLLVQRGGHPGRHLPDDQPRRDLRRALLLRRRHL